MSAVYVRLDLLLITVAVIGAYVYDRFNVLKNTNTRRIKMARKSSQFRREATKMPYDLELENGTEVRFEDPNRLTTKSAFELARETDPEVVLRTLLGTSFDDFWAEFGDRPQNETNAVIEDVMEYYGADKGKLPNSPS